MTKKMDFRRLFSFLCLFNGVFLLLQLILILNGSGNFLSAVSMPDKVYIEILLSLLIHIFLYILLSILQALIILKLPFENKEKWMIWIWSLTIAALLSLNAWFFPASKFSQMLFPPLPKSLTLLIVLSSTIPLTLAAIYSLFQYKIASLAILCVVSLSLVINRQNNSTPQQQTAEKPNIVIIGIDSLTPTRITANRMPNLHYLLKQSTFFSDTISPLPRTYPAWVSILTGLYAQHHGARYNLIPAKWVKKENNLVNTMASAGYQTIYATDERRFSSIDKDFGFNQVIGPRFGVNDMLIGSFNDFPIINLIANLPFSQWLLPYNYMNRAAYYHYYPETFNHAIKAHLLKNKSQPIFLAVHYTLPHWPYSYAKTHQKNKSDPFNLHGKEFIYEQALTAVDGQMFQLYSFLQQNDFLNNAIVILLSDHGETLFNEGSRPISISTYQGKSFRFANYIKNKTATRLNTSSGHGSDLLSPDQFHSLLAFQVFNHQSLINTAQVSQQRASLLDIRPTLEAFIHAPSKTKLDGLSLKNLVMGKTNKTVERDFYLESGMLPNQSLSKEKSIELAQQLFEIDSEGRLQLKNQALDTLDKVKLYGILSHSWLLVTYPDDDKLIQVLLNLNSGHWSDDPQSSLFKKAHADDLFRKLSAFLPVQTAPQEKRSAS